MILLVLIVSLISPLSITFSHAGDGLSLVSLDVCNAPGASADSPVPATPAIHEPPCLIAGAEFCGLIEATAALIHPFPIASQEERPPKV